MNRNPLGSAIALAVALGATGSAYSQRATQVAQAPAAAKEAPTRPARRQEVTVRVLLLADNVQANPDEYVEIGTTRYIHFKSPRLKSPARPLAEPSLRYPAGALEQRNGAVILQLLIDERGALVGSDVVCAAPHFARSALESVQGMKFQPAIAREGPVRSYMLVEFSYGKGFPCGRMPG